MNESHLFTLSWLIFFENLELKIIVKKIIIISLNCFNDSSYLKLLGVVNSALFLIYNVFNR